MKETKERTLKPILKESTESLGKLKLVESNIYCEQGIIDKSKVEKKAAQLTQLSPKLPEDIEDIDAGDNNSPLLMSIYIKDIYRYLTELEEKYPIEADYLKIQVCFYETCNLLNNEFRTVTMDVLWLGKYVNTPIYSMTGIEGQKEGGEDVHQFIHSGPKDRSIISFTNNLIYSVYST